MSEEAIPVTFRLVSDGEGGEEVLAIYPTQQEGNFNLQCFALEGEHSTCTDEYLQKPVADQAQAARTMGALISRPGKLVFLDRITSLIDKRKVLGSDYCPHCYAFGAQSESPEFTNDKVTQEGYCQACGEEWQDTYSLTHVE